MDRDSFDSLIRSFLPSGTRRGALAALLGGALGAFNRGESGATKKKKKRKSKKQECRCSECPCPGGRVRLANDTCAEVCETDEDCPAICGCANLPSVEDRHHCLPPFLAVSNCDNIPQTCTSTAQCPLGQVCQETLCEDGANRCVPLCG